MAKTVISYKNVGRRRIPWGLCDVKVPEDNINYKRTHMFNSFDEEENEYQE
ncbi:MAG: hypothetical protein ABIK93_08825 [candidate division WOR-3 bacterium]